MPVDIGRSESETKVISLIVDGIAYSSSDIDAKRFYAKDLERVEYEWPLNNVNPGQEICVEIEQIFFKEITDSDIWSSAYPTMKLNYSVRFEIPVKRFGAAARSITALKELSKEVEAGFGDWEIDGPFLIDNSVTFWWDCRAG